jgi:hypothetical protein
VRCSEYIAALFAGSGRRRSVLELVTSLLGIAALFSSGCLFNKGWRTIPRSSEDATGYAALSAALFILGITFVFSAVAA